MADPELERLREEARRVVRDEQAARAAAARRAEATRRAPPATPARPRGTGAHDRFLTWFRLRFPYRLDRSGLEAGCLFVFIGALLIVSGGAPSRVHGSAAVQLGVPTVAVVLLCLRFPLWLIAPVVASGYARLALAAPLNVVVPAALVGGQVAAMVVSWLRFRSWRSRLPFTLLGWASVVDQIRVEVRGGRRAGTIRYRLGEDVWQPSCAIRVALPERAPAPVTTGADGDPYRAGGAAIADDPRADLVLAALVVFCARANRRFYRAVDPDDDTRVRWRIDGLGASGSVNARVLWDLHRLCRGELAMLARKLGPFEVTVATSGDFVEVEKGFLGLKV